MIEIRTKRNHIAIIDDCDADLATLRWNSLITKDRIYLQRNQTLKEPEPKSHQLLHRVILERKIGRILLPGELCDHIDDNPLNNKRDNLRVASKAENMRNTTLRANSTSGYKGVSWDKNASKWEAYITVFYKKIHLGKYSTPEDAYAAYCEAAKKYFGEFARLK